MEWPKPPEAWKLLLACKAVFVKVLSYLPRLLVHVILVCGAIKDFVLNWSNVYLKKIAHWVAKKYNHPLLKTCISVILKSVETVPGLLCAMPFFTDSLGLFDCNRSAQGEELMGTDLHYL